MGWLIPSPNICLLHLLSTRSKMLRAFGKGCNEGNGEIWRQILLSCVCSDVDS